MLPALNPVTHDIIPVYTPILKFPSKTAYISENDEY
jgi:hypothetical protein